MDSRINTAVMDEIMRVGAEMQDQSSSTLLKEICQLKMEI